jgi:predicted porin
MSTGATANTQKARLWSLGAQYNNGPIVVGVSYEKHQNFYGTANVPTGCTLGSATPNCSGSDERAWVIAGSYTFPVGGGLKLGAHYSQQKADTAVGAGASTQKVNTWMIGMDWKIAGPHGVRVNYASAGNISGTGTLCNPGTAGCSTIGSTGQGIGVAMGQRPLANTGGQTGAYQWSVRYVYSLSKRTEAGVGYSQLKNKANANYEVGGVSTTVSPGSDGHAYAVFMAHRF